MITRNTIPICLLLVGLVASTSCNYLDNDQENSFVVPIDTIGKEAPLIDTLKVGTEDTVVVEIPPEEDYAAHYFNFHYNLQDPNETYKLPNSLMEISGLSYLEKDLLACVEDENGSIYIYDLKKEEVRHEYKFAGGGDYEGIEIIGKRAYILKSSGDIYIVKEYYKDKPEVSKNENLLSKRNDAEGLGYDPLSNSLLVACKGYPFHENRNNEFKAIYRFDLGKEELSENPYYVLEKEDIRALFPSETYYSKFEPSAIAVHPITHDVYVLSYVSRKLLVLSHNGSLKFGITLDHRLFKQPEGLCFAPDGDMFISNEGQDSKAKIHKFKYTTHPVLTTEILH